MIKRNFDKKNLHSGISSRVKLQKHYTNQKNFQVPISVKTIGNFF